MYVCASKHKCVSLQAVNQRPYVQSCTELIADPSSVAHLKQNKKHPHQKKPQWREFLKCSAALCTSKRPTSATKTSLKSSANNGHFQKAERGQRDGKEREGWKRLCASLSTLQPFMVKLHVSWQQLLALSVVWSTGQCFCYPINKTTQCILQLWVHRFHLCERNMKLSDSLTWIIKMKYTFFFYIIVMRSTCYLPSEYMDHKVGVASSQSSIILIWSVK